MGRKKRDREREREYNVQREIEQRTDRRAGWYGLGRVVCGRVVWKPRPFLSLSGR